jgi:DNA-binding transcriptional ArsR family regulator
MNEDLGAENLNEEQLKALYDPIRIRIAHLLKSPRTPKQVADIINIRPNNLYYHFRVLENAGIIEHTKTVEGKGFIKENFYQLKSPDFIITPRMVPLAGRLKFFQNLVKAAMEDLSEALDKFDSVSGVGSRDDFCLPEDKLEDARNILIKRKDKLLENLQEYYDSNGECNYQVNFFSFRL